MKRSKKAWSVGEISKRSGVAVSALHFYEAQGLISAGRNSGNQRRYSSDVLRRIAVIKTAQQLGISLQGIKAAFSSLPDSRTPTKTDWSKLSKLWRGDLQQRIDHLEKLRDQLDGCIGCGCLSMKSCKLRNPDDVAAEKGKGAIYLSNQGSSKAH